MRAFVAYLLALGLVAMPAMAAPGATGDKDKDNTAAKSSSTDASDKDTSAKGPSPTPRLIRQHRGRPLPLPVWKPSCNSSATCWKLSPSKSRFRTKQMREQQERMEAMEAELKVATTPRDTSYAPAPDSRVPKTADGSAGYWSKAERYLHRNR